MSKSPFLSIVLPTRDRPKLVEQCLACIKAQDFQDYEVIISDNALAESCYDVVAPFLTDLRFKYVRPLQPLSMTDNWEYAISFATGDYIAMISEKFMFRPDAFSVLKELAAFHEPDIMTWQYDHFELTDGQSILGNYHPLLKPVVPQQYAAADELKRRLDFTEPLFSRYQQEKNSYGKIYSGCVKRQITEQVRSIFGRVFTPLSPDFTSMLCFLSQSERCLDIGQSLMLLVSGHGISNGSDTRKSIGTIVSLLNQSHAEFEKYCQAMIIPGFGVGHSVSIASDYQKVLNISQSGHLATLQLNKAAILGWARLDLGYVEDWAGYHKSDFLAALAKFESQLSADERLTAESVVAVHEYHLCPSPREIYHSGLTKVDYFLDGITAAQLAELHWQQKIALPRRNVGLTALSVRQAVDYLHQYNKASMQFLGLS